MVREKMIQPIPFFSRHRSVSACVFLATLGFAVYANAVHGDFVYDDNDLVRDNHALQHPFDLSALNRNLSAERGMKTFFFRPLVTFTYAVDHYFWKLDVRGYHLTNILWHVLASLAIYALILQLYRDRLAAFLSALFFTLHPVHTEAVAYISGRADPLCLFFFLLSFILYIRSSENRRPASFSALFMGIFYGAALLCKEHALIFLPIVGAYSIIFKKNIKLWPTLLALIITSLYLFIRLEDYRLLGAIHPYKSDLITRLPGVFASFAQYARLLAVPLDLHMEYGMRFYSWSDPRVLAGLGLFLSTLGVACVHYRNRMISFPLIWYIGSLVPVSNLFALNASMAEHWLYLPSVGIFMLASFILARRLRSRHRVAAVAVTVALAAAFGFLTVRQNRTWRDAVQFYERTLSFEPDSARMVNNLGTALQERGKIKEATKVMEKAVAMNPQASESQYNLGNLYALEARYAEARACYQKAVTINPKFYLAHYNLGVIAEGLGERDAARKSYTQAVQANPRFGQALNKLRMLEESI